MAGKAKAGSARTLISGGIIAGADRDDLVPRYQLGQQVVLFCDFSTEVGALANTTAVLKVRAPDGTVTTPATTNPSTGRYESRLTLSAASINSGVWSFRFEGTGTVVAVDERRFEVAPSPFYAS